MDTEQEQQEEFGLGPAWARNTRCCGKPAGCTNMSDQCSMLGHPWKKKHREMFGADEDRVTDTA